MDEEGGLVALGAALEDIDQVRVGVVLHVLPVDLQQHIPLPQLCAAGVVHDQLHHGTKLRLTCKGKKRVSLLSPRGGDDL